MSKTYRCTKCHKVRRLRDFHRSPKQKNGRHPRCKQCRSAAETEAWRSTHPNAKTISPQHPGQSHKFHCGCEGILPANRGDSNQFVRWSGEKVWRCRIAVIIEVSQATAKRGNYQPISISTPHSRIRALMETPICVCCHQHLLWEFNNHKTPHLHHINTTGDPIGFAHPRCNFWAIEREVDRLQALLKANGISY